MEKKYKKYFVVTIITFAVFIAYTLLVKFVDVGHIGPNNSSVGFSHINKAFHRFTGTHLTLYNIIDISSLLPVVLATIFAVTGLVQWIKRKSILKVDTNILALGIFFALTGIVYFTFQILVINYRPVLIKGKLEASYPSSTTILALTFMLAMIYQIRCYIKSKKLRITFDCVCIVYCVFLLVGRIISGVHWLTDIGGGIIISVALLSLYYALLYYFEYLKNKKNN